ncbi:MULTISPECIES: polysaccharide biosynthesis tyrosine autokinase [unclassified Rhizobium]|uniref:polysaccharide biosynthesis tyrosine autokinase n=1 Tax=unclassified Rhizobium TaxID=2613769 RepID=UPI00116025ED|nr:MULTISPECIES: polysaccharide biosynthesis tyrosine autokinase [unclassified Rhizobium]MBO9099404.1 polysaccharide biosynthesis tyrosine autokinase [Rhizobium sp. L58/93]QXZ87108.1 polysaccharide biosynthesis tyrosine autokinase [Rhizobium sp. K1/93]QXZ92858.1 polysaccharide biosynthesis tyrosine autokinase [Rhizobium sp. K15/93]TQX84060.1 polysaccharide biosynthesis tyrosine autokinase [Rhizobium sp. rho-13.1]TQY06724.1 polysaccharide biosynthesis tyrosine autokinase [Rhizobium sp. rho-1.1]
MKKFEDSNLLSPDKIDSLRHDWNEDESPLQTVDVEKLLAIARRQWRIVAISVVVAVLLGIAYAVTAVPLYTATSSLLIDRGNDSLVNRLSQEDSTPAADDEASILSQVEVLKSDTIGLSVVDQLKLGENPVFMASGSSLIGRVRGAITAALNSTRWFVSANVDGDLAEKNRREALRRVQDGMDISRVGRTYVLNISFTSPSADLSASIANAIPDAYITDKLDSKYDSTRRASDWLQARIDELKQKSLETDGAVQKFRADNGLLSTGGTLISDQQLSELNSALIVAHSDTSKAKARYDRIAQIVKNGQSNAVVTDILDSAVSNDLRQKYLTASKLEADISNRLGPNHVRAVQLRGEMQEYERLMFEELSRYQESYKSEYDVAQAREKDLAENVAKAKGESAVAGQTGVQLRELERAADSYKNLYQTFLQRYQEAVQQQSFPITEARVITRPVKPDKPKYPRKPLVIALFGVLGAAFGSAVGGFREMRDRFFRTGEQVRDGLHLEFLGLAPLIKVGDIKPTGLEEGHPRGIRRANNISNYVVEHPMSAFAETLRSAKIAVDLAKKGPGAKVIGVASTLPTEGKSTISMNFAELLAMQGARTLLIDCDLRNPGTTLSLARHAEAGLVEVLTEGRPMKELLLLNDKTRLAFLPAVVKRRIPHSSQLLSSSAMNELLDSVRTSFDYIILDLPPLAPVVDARAIAAQVDAFLFVVEWGKTTRKVVRSTLRTNLEIVDKCIGVILNKVDNEKMKLYRAYGSSEYYHSRYTSYYRED